LEIILNNLVENKIAKKRELYYMDPKLFQSQSHVDQLLKEISLNIQVPRNSLNIVNIKIRFFLNIKVASNKGLVSGSICFQEENEVIDLCSFLTSGQVLFELCLN